MSSKRARKEDAASGPSVADRVAAIEANVAKLATIASNNATFQTNIESGVLKSFGLVIDDNKEYRAKTGKRIDELVAANKALAARVDALSIQVASNAEKSKQ